MAFKTQEFVLTSTLSQWMCYINFNLIREYQEKDMGNRMELSPHSKASQKHCHNAQISLKRICNQYDT